MAPGAIVAVAVVVGLGVALLNLGMRRRGYAIPGRTPVRCARGHLFTTVWVEGGSLKAVRLGPTTRLQRCPVGRHWTIVHPVKPADLTDEERAQLGLDGR